MMNRSLKYSGVITVAFVLGPGLAACNSGARASDDSAATPRSEASAAATPVTPAQPETARDTPPAGAEQPSGQAAGGGGPKVSQAEYEGWRQYSVNCARCHGQDVLPNPVAANLLLSLAPGGPMDTYEKFHQVVSEGRAERGMPAFKAILTADQIKAMHAYVKGRADKRIPPGRPARPSS
jgi:mono/diheme cytochrome c family protein